MPFTLDFAEQSTITVHASGSVTFDEVEAVFDDLLADTRLCCGVRMFVDGRQVERAPSTSELRAIARDMRPLLDRGLGPVAIVTSSTFVYGVARMFCVFADAMGVTIQAFRSMDEAHDWLAAQTSAVA